MLFVIFVFGFDHEGIASKKEDPGIVTGLNLHYGFVILHSQDIRPVGRSYPWGVSFNIGWQHDSESAFNSCLCYPRLGVSTTFWDFDNPEILGQGITSVFYVEPFFGAWRKFSFSFKSGFGLAYANKPYDINTNPDNLSYSTRISFALELSAKLNYRFYEQWVLTLNAGYNHISNGGMNEPNKGINFPTASFGIEYYIRNTPGFKRYKPAAWKNSNSSLTSAHIWFFGTAKQITGTGELKRYPVMGAAGRISRQVSRINALNLGFELMGDGAHREEIRRNGKNTDHKKAGILIGNEFLLGKFNFSQLFGVYIYDPYGRDADVFQRYALDYQLSKMFFSGIGLKAHGHVADFLDLRIGIKF